MRKRAHVDRATAGTKDKHKNVALFENNKVVGVVEGVWRLKRGVSVLVWGERGGDAFGIGEIVRHCIRSEQPCS
jgi:hypothetical protein